MTALLIAGLAVGTFVLRGAAPVLPRVPRVLTERTTGLAPALLAALVMTQLASGGLRFDRRDAAVAVAAGLAALRVPFLACVIAGAAVAALLRAVVHGV